MSKSLVYLSPKTKLLSKLIQAAAKIGGETLESVSLCTRFSGFSTISSFSFNRLGSKLVMVSMFLEIVPMFVAKDFARRRADMREFWRVRTFWRVSARRSNPEQNP